MTCDAQRVEVVYEDNHLLAVNKPFGLLTQPSGSSRENLEDRAKAAIKASRSKPGNVFLHAVHRLDKVASGVTLFALTGKALSRINEQMRRNEVKRIYHAVIAGELPAGQGVLEHFLRHSRMRSLPAGENEAGAKKASLAYRVIARRGTLSLVEVTLQTGRYHQIRAQLSAAGCPIVGDTLYGSRMAYAENGIALHHRRMEFTHPVRRDPVVIEAGYPEPWPVHPGGASPARGG